jgi:sec-independent protein translocase protein TatC
MPAAPDSFAKTTEPEPPAMGFFEHLAELRQRLLYSIAAAGVGCLLGLYFWEPIYRLLAVPIFAAFARAGLDQRLVFTSPLEPVKFALQVGLYAGIFLAAPFIFWQVWLFVAPGLYRNERRIVLPFILSSSALFLLGGWFAHGVVLPLTLTFLLEFGKPFFQALISINEYFSLWLTMVIWMGIIFQMPVLIFILSWLGVVTPGFLWHYFRHAMVVIALMAAVVTPTTDAFTMMVFAAPMIALYTLGIGVSYLVHLRRRARA